MNRKRGETTYTSMSEPDYSKPQPLINRSSTDPGIVSSNHNSSVPSCEKLSTPKNVYPSENTVSTENVSPSDNQTHVENGAQSNNLSHLENVVPYVSMATGNNVKTGEYITQCEDDSSNIASSIDSDISSVALLGSIKSHSVHFEDQIKMKEEEKSDHLDIDSNDGIDFQTNYENIQLEVFFHSNSSYDCSNDTDDDCENSDSDSSIDIENGSPDSSPRVEQPSNSPFYNSIISVPSNRFDMNLNAGEQFPQSSLKLVETSIKSDQPIETDNENHAVDTLDAAPSNDQREDGNARVHDDFRESFDIGTDQENLAIDTLDAAPSNDHIGTNVKKDGNARVHDEVRESFDIESDPPCISGKHVTTEDILIWIDGTLKYLNSQDRFSSLIDATWSKSLKTKFRGFEDDPKTGHSALFRDLQLKQLFYILSKSCPIAKSYLAQHSTSLKGVWKLVFHHFGYYDYEC